MVVVVEPVQLRPEGVSPFGTQIAAEPRGRWWLLSSMNVEEFGLQPKCLYPRKEEQEAKSWAAGCSVR